MCGLLFFIIFVRFMFLTIFKALVVGVIAAIPIGPILVMVVQRTLCYGRRSGWTVGLGAATGDTLYAAVGLLAVALLRGFIERNAAWIMLIGGLLVGVIGFGMLRRRVSVNLQDDTARLSPWTCYLQGLAGTLSNPLALGVMMALLALFGLGSGELRMPVVLAPCVGVGECIYWFCVTWVLSRYLRLDVRTLRTLTIVAGAIVCVFAVVLVVRGAVMLIGS